MAARLQCHIKGSPRRVFRTVSKGIHLRMGPAEFFMPAFADNPAIFDNHRPYHGVWSCMAHSPYCQFQRPGHKFSIFINTQKNPPSFLPGRWIHHARSTLLSSGLYRRLWNFTRPTSMMRFVGFTTGGDLHPALKRFKILYYYNRLNRKGKRADPRQGKSSKHKPALYVKA